MTTDLMTARKARDHARGVCLYGPRNTASPWADTFARWCRADAADRAAYDAAVQAVRDVLKGTRYQGADPEYV